MTDLPARPVPLLGDLALHAVQQIEHALDGGFASTGIVGLEGELQQRSGRRSHRVHLVGELSGNESRAQLAELQRAATAGEELTFAADITTALELQRVVISEFVATEHAGRPDRWHYDVRLVESAPLPPPAQVDPLGGLGDLGIDAGVLDEISELGGQVAGAVDRVMDAVDQLQSVVGVLGGGLPSTTGVLTPLMKRLDAAGEQGRALGEAVTRLATAFGGA